MAQEYTNIPVFRDTALELEKLQLDMKIKGTLKTKDELVKMLINFYKKYNGVIKK